MRDDVAWADPSSGAAAEPRLARGRRAEVPVERKPEWLRPRVEISDAVLATRRTVRELGLVTVCEEAGCPNLSECWADGTATYMVLGERCTRACGFCLVDTRAPLAPDADEPRRVAEAARRMGLAHVVLTMVARDDLTDGGMAHVAACVREVRRALPGARVETLVSDARGGEGLGAILEARPDVLAHNVETVPRLQREVRPSAGYARSLAVLARARAAGLVTKSGFMLGLGERPGEVEATLVDLASVGVSIVTIGQYLRPTAAHLPVRSWPTPEEYARWARVGESLGIAHVEASPLTRSSYHARAAHDAAAGLVPAVPVALRAGALVPS
jgi:lipoic acid synthetase